MSAASKCFFLLSVEFSSPKLSKTAELEKPFRNNQSFSLLFRLTNRHNSTCPSGCYRKAKTDCADWLWSSHSSQGNVLRPSARSRCDSFPASPYCVAAAPTDGCKMFAPAYHTPSVVLFVLVLLWAKARLFQAHC